MLQLVPTASYSALISRNMTDAFLVSAAIAALLMAYLSVVMIRARRMREAAVQEKETQLAAQVELTLTDGLTGLYNRRAYEDDLLYYPKIPTEDNYVYFSIDVNGLKQANDTLGHAAGDELLLGVAECLQRCLGGYGKLYRVGGDEFVAQVFIDREHLEFVTNDLNETMLAWSGKAVKSMSFSVGYAAHYDHPGKTVAELARIADECMYRDKEHYYSEKGVDRRSQQTAYAALCASYTKILRVDLTRDSYRIIMMDQDEQTPEMGFSSQISAWLHGFGRSGQVHPEDLPSYLEKTDLAYLRAFFAQGGQHLNIFYRRRIGSVYRQAMMEMLPAEGYTNEEQSLYLYVKDIDRISAPAAQSKD